MNWPQVWFAVFGIGLTGFGAASILLSFMNSEARKHGGHDLRQLLPIGTVMLILGIGVLCYGRWSILTASLLSAALGLWAMRAAFQLQATVQERADPFFFGVLFLLPALLSFFARKSARRYP
jgi:hypothetical protein